MTLVAPKPGSSFVSNEVLTHTQMNTVNTQLPYALDGNAGGTYAPSAPLIVNGSGLRTNVAFVQTGAGATSTFAGPVDIDNDVEAINVSTATGGSVVYRITNATDTNMQVGLDFENVLLVGGAVITAPRTFTLNDATTSGSVWEARYGTGAGSDITIVDAGAAPLYTLSQNKWVKMIYSGSTWVVLAQGTVT